MEERDEQLEYYDRLLWERILKMKQEAAGLAIQLDLAVLEAQKIIDAKD